MRGRIGCAAALCALLILAGCKADLYTGLSEREANEMIAALLSAGIPASKSTGAEGLTVAVDEARFSEAMDILGQRGLPAHKYQSMGDVFRKEGLVSSPTEERARMVYALSEELSRTIAEIDGVLSARIHVVLPQSDMLGRDVKPSSASVFVRYSPKTDVEQYAAQIKLLVANSIEGLNYDNISVVMVPAAADAAATAEPMNFANVLGMWVHPGSVQRLWIVLGVMAAMIVALAGAVAYPHIRPRKAKPAPSTALAELGDEGPL